jgi:hypothetical protein
MKNPLRFHARSLAILALTLASAAAGCGTDPEESCGVFCDKSVECQPDGPGRDACVSVCLEQANDEAYADALAEQIDCYEDSTCDEINNSACVPQNL